MTALPKTSTLVDLNGLENLGDAFLYQGRVIIDGEPLLTGTFTVDDNRALSQDTFTLDATMLSIVIKFALKPLAGMIPADAIDIQQIESNVSASFPDGSIKR